MNADWKSTTWGEIATLEYGKGLLGYQVSEGKYPVYGANGQIGWHSEPLYNNPGVIIGRKGAYRGVHYSKIPFFVIDTAFYLKPKVELVPRWAYYQLLTQDINGLDSGSAIPSTSRQDFYSLPLLLPPLPVQQKIASILGALDDKIEFNRRMNKTLEEIAQALFRHWFVENPEAKGWEEKPLDEIADFLNGLAMQKYPQESDEYLPVIKIAQLRKNDSEGADKASTNIPSEYVVEDGDILFSWSGSLEVVIWCGGKGALNQHLFNVTSSKYPKWFYYFWIKHYLPDFQEIAAGKATTMGHIQRHHLHDAPIKLPPGTFINPFDLRVTPILEKIILNEKEIRSLAKIRDLLLPKLMAGDLV
jgi:type I restriction enzyme, S subunit